MTDGLRRNATPVSFHPRLHSLSAFAVRPHPTDRTSAGWGHLVIASGVVRTTRCLRPPPACSRAALLDPVKPVRATQRSHLGPLTVGRADPDQDKIGIHVRSHQYANERADAEWPRNNSNVVDLSSAALARRDVRDLDPHRTKVVIQVSKWP